MLTKPGACCTSSYNFTVNNVVLLTCFTLALTLPFGTFATSEPVDSGSGSTCKQQFGDANMTVLMVAVGGRDTPGEAFYYKQNLENEVIVPANETICGYKSTGSIYGQDVMMVVAGIGPVNSALCTYEILTCATNVKEIIFTGSSGWSSQVGGVFNPPANCDPNESNITRIGDVCVSTSAVQWDCRTATWDEQCQGFPNVCSLPQAKKGPQGGDCLFDSYSPGDVRLADELAAANAGSSPGVQFPARGDIITSYENQYWGNMSEATNIFYPYDPSASPTLWSYTQCAEATSQFFWSGATYDVLARQHIALVISNEFNISVGQADVVGVTAEESTGVLSAIAHYNLLAKPSVPVVVVRGASNFDYIPLAPSTSDGVWKESTTFKSDVYQTTKLYCYATYSTAVFNLLAARCYSGDGGDSPEGVTCQLQYGVPFPPTAAENF